eukprot:2090771-Pyramimonas_sp.AAC.1
MAAMFPPVVTKSTRHRVSRAPENPNTGGRPGGWQVMWDQAVVNDVYHQMITDNKTYFRCPS